MYTIDQRGVVRSVEETLDLLKQPSPSPVLSMNLVLRVHRGTKGVYRRGQARVQVTPIQVVQVPTKGRSGFALAGCDEIVTWNGARKRAVEMILSGRAPSHVQQFVRSSKRARLLMRASRSEVADFFVLVCVCETWIVNSNEISTLHPKSSKWSQTTCGFQQVKCPVESSNLQVTTKGVGKDGDN